MCPLRQSPKQLCWWWEQCSSSPGHSKNTNKHKHREYTVICNKNNKRRSPFFVPVGNPSLPPSPYHRDNGYLTWLLSKFFLSLSLPAYFAGFLDLAKSNYSKKGWWSSSIVLFYALKKCRTYPNLWEHDNMNVHIHTLHKRVYFSMILGREFFIPVSFLYSFMQPNVRFQAETFHNALQFTKILLYSIYMKEVRKYLCTISPEFIQDSSSDQWRDF